MTHRLKPKIAIIGGGYAGCAAAVRVIELGGVPTVFEAARVLGGRARRIAYQGHVLDNGQHILSGAYTELLRLMNVIGVSSRSYERVPMRLNMPPRFRMQAPLLPAPLHVAFALLFARGLSLFDRIGAVRMMAALKKRAFAVDPSITVASLLQAHNQSTSNVRYLWQPITVSALNTPIEQASAQVFANVLRDALAGQREASDFLLPRVDLSALFPEPAQSWVIANGGGWKLGLRVDRIHTVDDKVRVVSTSAPDSSELFDAAILAVGPHQRQELPIDGKSADAPGRYEPIATIYFGFAGAPRLPEAMFGQADGLVQWFFDRSALATDATDGDVAADAEGSDVAADAEGSDVAVFSAVISASGEHEAMSQDALAAAALNELRRHAPSLAKMEPLWSKVVREKFATFACTPDALRPTLATHSARVFLAGDDVLPADPNAHWRGRYPGTIESAVRSGVSAADAAMRVQATTNTMVPA
jgi:hydroxysqualene dehydroxylase